MLRPAGILGLFSKDLFGDEAEEDLAEIPGQCVYYCTGGNCGLKREGFPGSGQ